MLTFLGAVLRVLIGFVAACLAAGFVQVLFAVTPAELVVAGDQRMNEAVTWGLLTATQIAVFSFPFAIIAILFSEWLGVRSFAYHAIVAMAIAVAGFGLIHATESPAEASIVNSYAMAAYLTSGFVGGFFYWLFAGRRATRISHARIRMESNRKSISDNPAATAVDTSPRGRFWKKRSEPDSADSESETGSAGGSLPDRKSAHAADPGRDDIPKVLKQRPQSAVPTTGSDARDNRPDGKNPKNPVGGSSA